MSDLIALLDLGSNAVRFVLARIYPGIGFDVLEKQRVQTRLGGGRDQGLPPEAVDVTLASVHRFLGPLRRELGPRVLAIATAAVRDAPNRDLLLDGLRRREGIDVEILGGEEEARLGALAALRSLPFQDGVVADLGGGSLQLSVVTAGRVSHASSLPLGAVRTTQRFLGADPPAPAEIRALRQEIREHLLGALPSARSSDRLLGIGGNVRAVAGLHVALVDGRRPSRHGLVLGQADVSAIREQLEALPLRKRCRVPGLKADRADIILAGAITLEEVMLFGGYPSLTVCKNGVRDGVLWRETFGGLADGDQVGRDAPGLGGRALGRPLGAGTS